MSSLKVARSLTSEHAVATTHIPGLCNIYSINRFSFVTSLASRTLPTLHFPILFPVLWSILFWFHFASTPSWIGSIAILFNFGLCLGLFLNESENIYTCGTSRKKMWKGFQSTTAIPFTKSAVWLLWAFGLELLLEFHSGSAICSGSWKLHQCFLSETNLWPLWRKNLGAWQVVWV